MFEAQLSFELAQRQHQWLSPARSRLLRAAQIQRRRRIVDLGCGWGMVTAELAERCEAQIIGLDLHEPTLESARRSLPEAFSSRVNFQLSLEQQLALQDASVDMIFAQCAFLWMKDPQAMLSECRRVLADNGVLALLEPDYGGIMEWPESISTRDIWLDALQRAGAEPLIGRKLHYWLKMDGWQVESCFLDRYEQPHADALEFLLDLPLSVDQHSCIEQTMKQVSAQNSNCLIHLPFWLIIAS